MPTFGTNQVLDTIAASQQTLIKIGEDDIFKGVRDALTAHNILTDGLIMDFAEYTTDRKARYGGAADMSMDELDEYGAPDAQKVAAGQTVEFPLRKFGRSVQWTRDYMEVTTGEEFVAQFVALQDADINAIARDLKKALFVPTNYTFIDRFTDYTSASVKRLLNADGAPIPIGPNGEVFVAATHTHYLATAALIAADITNAIETVIEHYPLGQARLYINRASEAGIRAFNAATQFTGYLDARIVQGSTVVSANGSVDQTQLYNRSIGVWGTGGAEVWVKPWVPAGYMYAFIKGAPKPLKWRYDARRGKGLRMAADFESYPLRAKAMERYGGFGVWNRANGAILYTGGASYVAPTIV